MQLYLLTYKLFVKHDFAASLVVRASSPQVAWDIACNGPGPGKSIPYDTIPTHQQTRADWQIRRLKETGAPQVICRDFNAG
jgi:hypothetical protein